MSTFELVLRIVGASHIVLALAHIPIARHLHWEADLLDTSLLTRQIFWSHTFFVCVVLFLMGALGVYAPRTLLVPSELGLYVTGGLTLFWSLRLIFQWFVYERVLWLGKPFETAIHVLFSATWITYTAVYALAFKDQLQL